MSTAISARARSLSEGLPRASRLDVIDKLFVLSAFVAGINLSLFQALTAYDVMIAVLAFMIAAGPRRMQLPPPYVILASFVFVAAALLSLFRALYPIEAVTQMLQFAFVFWVQIPVVLTIVRSRRILHAAVIAFIAGSAVSMIVAAVLGEDGGANRLATYYTDNANALGFPVAFLTPFLLYYVVTNWRRHGPTFSLIATAGLAYLFLWILSASASRAAAAATITGILVFVMLRGGRVAWRRLPVRLVASALCLVGAGFAIFNTGVFSSRLEERVVATVNPTVGSVTDQRTSLNRGGLNAFAESPLVGVGLNNFRHVSQFHDDAGTFHDPHNLWVQFLAQIGLFGTLAFLALVVTWFMTLYRAQARAVARTDLELCWAFIAAMAAILMFHMASPIMIQRHVWLVFALGLACAQVVAGQSRSRRVGTTPAGPSA